MLLGFRHIIDLQREHPDGIEYVRNIGIGREQTTELDTRGFILFFSHQAPGIGQTGLLAVGVGSQPGFQEVELRRSLGQQLRLEQGRKFPVRAQRQRLIRFTARAVGIPRRRGHLGADQTGFGQRGIGLGKLVEQALNGRFVRIAGEGAHHADQRVANVRGFRRQVAGEIAGQFIDAAVCQQQRRFHLLCLLRRGLQAQPQSHGLQRRIILTRMKGDLGRPAHHAWIAGALRQIEIGTGRKPELASLRGDFGEQELVEDLPGQFLLRQPVFLLFGRWHRGGGRGCLRPCAHADQCER